MFRNRHTYMQWQIVLSFHVTINPNLAFFLSMGLRWFPTLSLEFPDFPWFWKRPTCFKSSHFLHQSNKNNISKESIYKWQAKLLKKKKNSRNLWLWNEFRTWPRHKAMKSTKITQQSWQALWILAHSKSDWRRRFP